MLRYPQLQHSINSTVLFALAVVVLVPSSATAILVGKYDAGLGVTTPGGLVTQWADQVGGYNLTNHNTPTHQTFATPKVIAIQLEGGGSDALGGPRPPDWIPSCRSDRVHYRSSVGRGLFDNDPNNTNFWGHRS
jgi:hypothetical protein